MTYPAVVAAAALLDVGKRLAQLTGRQLAALEPLLDEELADAVRHCATIPRRAKVGSPLPGSLHVCSMAVVVHRCCAPLLCHPSTHHCCAFRSACHPP